MKPLNNQLASELTCELWDQLGSELIDQVEKGLWSQLGSPFEEQFQHRVLSRLEDQLIVIENQTKGTNP
jgi:hypothetical protein